MTARPAERARPAGGAGTATGATLPWRSRAFGLELEGDFAAPGLPPAEGPARRPPTRLELVDEAALRAGWPGTGTERIATVRRDDGTILVKLDRHPEAGWLWTAQRFGRYHVSPDGRRLRIAPYRPETWNWQRLLIARVLPLAATLQGLELLHASAVRLRGRTVAVLAPTGAGKTSLALRLVLRGATFLTDDALALEPHGDHVVAHPGVALASVRPAEQRLLAARLSELGPTVSRGVKTHVALPRQPTPTRLDELLFLDGRGDVDALAIEPMPAVPATRLLGFTFNQTVADPDRLLRQLDVCARLAASTRAHRLRVPADLDAAGLAAVLDEHLAGAA